MTEQKHTPGDWQIVKNRLVTQPDPPNGGYVTLATFSENAETADKTLIARAPALLAENQRLREALKHCLCYLEADADDETEREDYAEAQAALRTDTDIQQSSTVPK